MARLLECGDVYFFYEPRRGIDRVTGVAEVQRLYVVLSGDRRFGRRCRLLALEGPVLPLARPGVRAASLAGRVEAESDRPEDMEAALATSRVGEPPTPQHPRSVHRPAGEGRYALYEHDGHGDFGYVLELPERPGPVQLALNIQPQASFRLARREDGALRPVLDPAALGEGTSLVLEAEGLELPADVRDQLGLQPEGPATAEIFAELKLSRAEYPTEPLYRGEWR